MEADVKNFFTRPSLQHLNSVEEQNQDCICMPQARSRSGARRAQS
jgi:hypothetical protein